MPLSPACAKTGLKATCTGRRPSRGFCRHRPFFTQTTVLTAKLAYLLALCGAQSISVPACVTVSLRDPVADRLDGRFEFTSQPLRSPSGSSQGDAQTIWGRKARGYGGLDFGMADTSSPKGQAPTKPGQLQCGGYLGRCGGGVEFMGGRASGMGNAPLPAAGRRLSPNTAQVASRRRPPVQASVLTFISTWMAKSRRMLAGIARKRSMAARTSLMSAITRDFLTGWSGS